MSAASVTPLAQCDVITTHLGGMMSMTPNGHLDERAPVTFSLPLLLFFSGTGSLRNVSVKHLHSSPNSPASVGRSLGVSPPVAHLDVSSASGRSSRRVKTTGGKKAPNMFAGTAEDSEADEEEDHVGDGTESKRAPRRKLHSITAASLDDGIGSRKGQHQAGLGSFRTKVKPLASFDSHDSDTASMRTKRSPRPHQVGDAADSPITPKLRLAAASDSDDGEDEFHSRFGRPGTGTGLASVRSAALRARMDDSGIELDPAYQDMVRHNPLHWADPDFAIHHTDQVWSYYTSHQRPSGGRDAVKFLDHSGLSKLASDLVDRFIERYRALLASTNPKFTPTQLEHALMVDLPHTVIAGGIKEIAAIKTHTYAILKRELDKDKDNKIGKMDFTMQVRQQTHTCTERAHSSVSAMATAGTCFLIRLSLSAVVLCSPVEADRHSSQRPAEAGERAMRYIVANHHHTAHRIALHRTPPRDHRASNRAAILLRPFQMHPS